MNLSTGRSKLVESAKTLAVHWETTRDGWGDRACQEFEEDHIAPIGPLVQSTVRALDRLVVVLAQMRQDCG